MTERLQKVLARAGVASRRASEEVIRKGRVTVNGDLVTTPGTAVDAETDDIRVDGARIKPERLVYWLVYKPKGVLCTSKDPEGRRRVIEMVPDTRHRLYPIGRLDEDSEGLIIVTNDGELAQLVSHPKHGVEKVYDLSIRGDITPAAVKRIESGIWLSEGKTAPAHMRIKRRGPRVSHVVVTIREGRNREIRRMFARIEHPILSLRRIQIGPIRDPRLKRGACRKLRREEIEELRAVARGEAPRTKLRRRGKKSGSGRSPASGRYAPRKPTTRKPVGKKPTGKKPVGKKPVGKKPVGKKPATRKPTGKKTGGRKPAGKKPAGSKKSGKGRR